MLKYIEIEPGTKLENKWVKSFLKVGQFGRLGLTKLGEKYRAI